MKKAIVTGANGFIGFNLVQLLLKRNIEVFAVINKSEERIITLKSNQNLHILKCNASVLQDLPVFNIPNDIDVFYHFAWSGNSGKNRCDQALQLRNITLAYEALQAAELLHCKKFLFAGSVMEYEIMNLLVKDNAAIGLGNIYSIAKMTADFMLKTYAANMEIDYINLIISNIYGPGEKSARLVNTTIRKMLSGEKTQFSSAKQQYDFIYISDAVEQIYLVGEKGIGNNSYYIGNPNQFPLRHYLEIIGNICLGHTDIGIGELGVATAALTYKEFDSKKVYMQLGYVNKVSFSDGIIATKNFIEQENDNATISL